MPEGTLKALADHGELGAILPADGGDCEEVLAQFAKAGIDVDALAAQLQDEGAKSFVKSWNELMEVIASKSAALGEGELGVAMNVLVVDVGGTHVKILATGQKRAAEVRLRADADAPSRWSPASRSSPGTGSMTWCRSAIPGPVLHGRPVAEPHNLGPGWVGFDFEPPSAARSR